jgi:hypothetical protein
MKKINLNNACFVKIGCNTCQKYREELYLGFLGNYKTCKDKYLSIYQKARKLLKNVKPS